MARIKGVNESGSPVGTIISSQSAHTAAPVGFLYMDGSVLTKSVYAALYAVLAGQVVETGTTFTLPDLRGKFLRGLDTTAAVNDPDKAARTGGDVTSKLGSLQPDAFASHRHTVAADTRGNVAGTNGSAYLKWGTDGVNAGTYNTMSLVGASTETRPKNFATNYFIAYI